MKYFLYLLPLIYSAVITGQTGPFVEPLYEVEITPDQVYGHNATILPVLMGESNEALSRPLLTDIYEPVNDNNNFRPVMLVLHSGNFLPFPLNNSTGGTKRDSAVVELCNRLASYGYLAMAIDYRLGWNPIAESQEERKFNFINAVYRAVQDARTAVRYIRKLAVDEGNTYKIDPEKIAYWGIGTGGFIATAGATLNEYAKLSTPNLLIGDDSLPAVIESINGNINGTSFGVAPQDYPGLPVGDTLCYPNHTTYDNGNPISSTIDFIVNTGGGLLDTLWIDEQTPPWLSFQTLTDIFPPYYCGPLWLNIDTDPDSPDQFQIMDVHGAYNIQSNLYELNINSIFNQIPDDVNDYSNIANQRNDGLEGLFPLPTDEPLYFHPWSFYAEDNPNVPPNPPPNPELARTYWDTIMAYTGVRACIALNLGCSFQNVETLDAAEIDLKLAPNPASDMVTVNTGTEYPIRNIQVFDISGRMVDSHFNLNSNRFDLQRNDLSSGMYFVRLRFDEGIAIQKLVFK